MALQDRKCLLHAVVGVMWKQESNASACSSFERAAMIRERKAQMLDNESPTLCKINPNTNARNIAHAVDLPKFAVWRTLKHDSIGLIVMIRFIGLLDFWARLLPQGSYIKAKVHENPLNRRRTLLLASL
ncbi:hypothetical protein AVEN_188392-1 [Araneus ventricosus]|uniref:Uncharacterized protein n=1 Tax=Araneus ventricosus TaxID=182803 RepID=A0A4Y2EBW1_ARAVE|nr:hypothetical protein AVEN_188392-1 [Araneus ventricosus]